MLRTKTLGFACLLLIPAVMTASVFAQSNESRLFQTERDAIAESVLVAEMQLTELESVYGKSHPKVKAIEGALAYLREKQRKLAEADYDAWANQRLTPMLDEITEEFGKLQLDDSQQEGVDLAFQQLEMIMQQVYERETEQARASLEQIRENAQKLANGTGSTGNNLSSDEHPGRGHCGGQTSSGSTATCRTGTPKGTHLTSSSISGKRIGTRNSRQSR